MGLCSARRATSPHPKCPAVVRTCKGNFVYFVKWPEGSKVIQEYCHTVAMDDTVLFKCAHQKDTGNLNILFLWLTHRMLDTVKSPISEDMIRNKCQRLFVFAFSESFKRSQVI